MEDIADIRNITMWRRALGLLAVPLFGDKTDERQFVLLNGSRGNFCLGIDDKGNDDLKRSWAWSSDVGHYVSLVGDKIFIHKWDHRYPQPESIDSRTVLSNFEGFQRNLEKYSPPRSMSVISHVARTYRAIRAELGPDFNGGQALDAFLYFLAFVASDTDFDDVDVEQWSLPAQSREVALEISASRWEDLRNSLNKGRLIEGLNPDLNLLLRHAAGQLFQEAHYEAVFIDQDQMIFKDFPRIPTGIRKNVSLAGMHFTPLPLVRTIVEESLNALTLNNNQDITVFDPACGSGEFLREVLKQLVMRNHRGKIFLIGRDISEAACHLARFILGWEKKYYTGQVEISIECHDSIEDNHWPKSDLILMNPPFLSWQNMRKSQRDAVYNILRPEGMGRPDLSYAFLLLASNALKQEGVLGCILPASLLGASSSKNIRRRLGDLLSPLLIGKLGSHQLFPNAIVDAAFYIARYGKREPLGSIAFWADHRSSSNSAGLRVLRRLRDSSSYGSLPVVGEGFSIYINPDLGRSSKNWTPSPFRSWKLVNSLKHLPKVENCFFVRQGVRSGFNKAFILSNLAFKRLPKSERAYFRPAIINESINYGTLVECAFIFYPYGDRHLRDESELRKKLPVFFGEHLKPNKEILLKRPRIERQKWWHLCEHRAWQVQREPKIVTTYFGGRGSFAWDDSGKYVVVQGFGWVFKPFGDFLSLPREIGLAYIAILNTTFFEELISAKSNHVGGGQWDLSSRFIKELPLPNLLSPDVEPTLLAELSRIGESIHPGFENEQENLLAVEADRLTRIVYRIGEFW